MKLIEADKVKQVMKDCLKAQVNKTLKLVNGNEANDRINSCLEYNHDLLKAIDELPSAEPDTTTHDSIPAETGGNYGDRTSGDCISRQQAIEAVVGCTNCGTEDVLRAYVTKHSLENGWTGGIVDALDAIELLPSVQPETNCSEIPNNSDTISRQAAIDALHAHLMYRMGTESNKKRLDEWINSLPSVQPERPTGEWIQKPRYEDDEYPDAQPNLKCPFCGYEIGWCDMGNYCARCGADLKGGAE